MKNQRKHAWSGFLGCYAMMLRFPFLFIQQPKDLGGFSDSIRTQLSVGTGGNAHALSCRGRKGHVSQEFAWQPQQALQIEVILE